MVLDTTTRGNLLLFAGSGIIIYGIYKLNSLLRFLVKPLPKNTIIKPPTKLEEMKALEKTIIRNFFTEDVSDKVKKFFFLYFTLEKGKDVEAFHSIVNESLETFLEVKHYPKGMSFEVFVKNLLAFKAGCVTIMHRNGIVQSTMIFDHICELGAKLDRLRIRYKTPLHEYVVLVDGKEQMPLKQLSIENQTLLHKLHYGRNWAIIIDRTFDPGFIYRTYLAGNKLHQKNSSKMGTAQLSFAKGKALTTPIPHIEIDSLVLQN